MDEHVDAARTVPLPSAAAFDGGATAGARAPAPATPTEPAPASPTALVAAGTPGPAALARTVPGTGASSANVRAADGSARPTPASLRIARGPVEPDDPEAALSADPDGTGDHAVDEALTLLTTLDALPLREHVAVFDGVHTALQDRLADTEG